MAESDTPDVPLREHFEALLALAERERDKAVHLLSAQIAQAIREGDQRLREHIASEVIRIDAALESAEKLELQRLDAALDRVTAVQRELELQQEAASMAIAKAESATEERFKSVNAFRAQNAEERANYLRTDVADAQFTEIRRALSDLAEKVNKIV